MHHSGIPPNYPIINLVVSHSMGNGHCPMLTRRGHSSIVCFGRDKNREVGENEFSEEGFKIPKIKIPTGTCDQQKYQVSKTFDIQDILLVLKPFPLSLFHADLICSRTSDLSQYGRSAFECRLWKWKKLLKTTTCRN